MVSVAQAWIRGEGDTHASRGDLDRFRREFHASLTARADALFELTDAVLCADGPVRSLVDLTLVAEHRRGHGAMYDALNQGLASSGRELPPPALPEPYVTVSRHTAPTVRRPVEGSRYQCANKVGW
jgi:hypothetical protein